MKGAELAIVMAAVAVSAAWADSQPTVTEALACLPKTHPRIFVSGQIDFDRVNERAGTTPEMAQLKEIVLATAEICCATPPVRGKDGMRMTGQDQFSESALTLAMAWRLTGDRRFAEALREQMLAVCEWPDWNPSHYLDTAEVLLGLSVGYDWCHDILTDAERVTIRTAMIKKGWETRYVNDGWQKAANNWPQVCWGMIGLTAVAIGAEEPDVAARMVGEILESMDPCLSVYAPHGAYPEGPGYWGYGTGYFLYMVAAFDSAFDTNFGLFDKPGISETGSFVDAMTAPSGDYWNFSDCGLERKVRVCDAYLAKKTGDRGILAFDIGFLRKFLTGYANRDIREKVRDVRQYVEGCLPLWLLWGDFGAVDETNAGALDYLSGGQNPVAVMRSSRAANAAYLGLKGGKSCANHGHMDQGSILWESDGYRWAMDIGPQNYTDLEAAGVDLWNAGQDSSRWKVYCLNNLSHNLVTVDGKLFSVTGFCDFVSTSFDGATASATLDLTPAVHPYATRGARRCSLDRATRTGTVEDGLKGLAPGSEVRWAIVTPAPYARVRGNDIILKNFAGDCLTLRCESPASVKWQVVDMGFQLNPWDYRHEDLTLVSFTEKVSADGMFKSRVKFIPGEPGGGILAAEDVSLQALTSAEASRVDRTYELQSSAGISAKIAEAEAAGVKSVVLTGNLRRLTTANVRRLRSAGVKVYLDARDRAEAMRYAALFGADGVCIGSEAGLEQDVPKVGARTVRFFFFFQGHNGGT